MKKNMKVFIAPIMAAAVGFSAFSYVGANEVPGDETPAEVMELNVPENPEEIDLSNILNVESKKAFTTVGGKVTEITVSEDKTVIRLENEEGGEFDFIVGDNAVFANQEGLIDFSDIEQEDQLTVHFVTPQIMTMIYPPQYQASVFVKDSEDGLQGVHVDYFDENLLSSGKDLKLNINPENPVYDQQGQQLELEEEELKDKVLMVFSTIMTMSLPAQTSPEKIVVLEGIETQLDQEDIPQMPDPDLDPQPQDGFNWENVDQIPLFVNGEFVEGAQAYMNDDEVLMVPLKALADAMDIPVRWDGAEKRVTLGVATSFVIGTDSYNLGRMVPITLGTAPVIKDNLTYVPVAFFTELMDVELHIDQGILDFVDSQGQDVDMDEQE